MRFHSLAMARLAQLVRSAVSARTSVTVSHSLIGSPRASGSLFFVWLARGLGFRSTARGSHPSYGFAFMKTARSSCFGFALGVWLAPLPGFLSLSVARAVQAVSLNSFGSLLSPGFARHVWLAQSKWFTAAAWLAQRPWFPSTRLARSVDMVSFQSDGSLVCCGFTRQSWLAPTSWFTPDPMARSPRSASLRECGSLLVSGFHSARTARSSVMGPLSALRLRRSR